jgi:hypothetical protein
LSADGTVQVFDVRNFQQPVDDHRVSSTREPVTSVVWQRVPQHRSRPSSSTATAATAAHSNTSSLAPGAPVPPAATSTTHVLLIRRCSKLGRAAAVMHGLCQLAPRM